MQSKLIAACLTLAAMVSLTSSTAAAPALLVNKGNVQPAVSWTGPFGDPHASLGQWFIPRFGGMEQYCSREFYDNTVGSGGGVGASAIKGVVSGVQTAPDTGNIVAFQVEATITNDQSGIGSWADGTDRHGETLRILAKQNEAMFSVRLSVSFAVDPQQVPTEWSGVRIKRDPLIYATDPDYRAWYCWTPTNEQGLAPLGGYLVPTYDFGQIAKGQSSTRTLRFTVADPGIPTTDPRYSVIMSSWQNGYDIFLNRTQSLKVSDWVDDCYTDTGMAYPPGGRGSDVSVFYDTYLLSDRDWGDAPDPTYPTLAASAGANHIIVNGFCLGAQIDSEADGQPSPSALRDDNTGVDDEDGVTWLTPLIPGQAAQVQVTAAIPGGTTGLLQGWIDFNGDGSWLTAGDQIITNQVLTAGVNVIAFNVPTTATPGIQTFARFRLSSVRSLPYNLAAKDGEVEDYTCFIEAIPHDKYDWGDAPDPTYPTLAASNGANHKITAGFCLGNQIDNEGDGQPDATATGDDLANLDDEDGVTFNTALFPGVPNTITVTASVPAAVALLSGWIDLNGDGDWSDAGEQVLANVSVVSGTNSLTFTPAAITATGSTFARFRLSTLAGLTEVGPAPDGEVEDYKIDIAPVKWIQRPDLSWYGVDVSDRQSAPLADDFLCTMSGPITDIHIWTSFLYDMRPAQLNGIPFTLSIYSDVPAGPNNPYSRPGDLLWSRYFPPGSYNAGLCANVWQGEWWYDPTTEWWMFPGDFNCYQYDFYIDRTEAFRQQKGTIYWLSVVPMQGMQATEFGWKSSLEHWNDDACWLDNRTGILTWRELRYGDGHPMAGDSMDLAFAITGMCQQEENDWGDAPDPTYPTLSASSGASHKIQQGFCLGNLIDAEADGQPNATATGDDLANLPDEDGVTWAPLVPGQTTPITVWLTTPGLLGLLDAWVDFDADGDWDESYDRIATALPLAAGANPVPVTVPRTFRPTPIPTFARFRLSTSAAPLPYTGFWSDGEVEDYAVKIEPDVGTLTFSKFKDIEDHFWWSGHPDPTNEMLSIEVGADLVEPVSWNSVTLALAGGEPGDVAKIEVWQDNNANGQVDAGDTSLGLAVDPPTHLVIVLTAPVIPAGGNIKALITYQMSPAAAVGTSYSFRVTRATGTGQLSGLPAYITGLPIPSCNKIVAPVPISIGAAKLQPVGSTVFLEGKICTAAFGLWNLFYIEESNRTAGIGVRYSDMICPATQDQIVSVLGTTSLLNNSELIILPTNIVTGPKWLPPIDALGMNNRATGGGGFGGQPAVADQSGFLRPTQWSVGLNNVGLLVRTWGLVTWHAWPYRTPYDNQPMFWIDDGTALHDGFWTLGWPPGGAPCKGVACMWLVGHPGSFPNIGEYWAVTGILRAIPNWGMGGLPYGDPVRLLVPRSFPEDLTRYPMTP